MIDFIKKLILKSINADNAPPGLGGSVTISNKIALITLIACLPYYTLFSNFHIADAKLATIMVACFMSGSLLLSYFSLFTSSRLLLVFGICASTLVMASIFGREANLQVCFVLAIALPFLIFRRSETTYLTISLFFPILFNGLLELTQYDLFAQSATIIPESLLEIINIMIVFTVQVIIWQMLQFFRQETDRRQDQLEASLRMQEGLLENEQKLSERIHQSYDNIKEYMYLISHDLSAPLRHLASRIDLLEEDKENKLSKNGHEQVTKMTQAVTRMQGMIHSLVDYARLDQDQGNFVAVKLSEVIQNIINEFESDIAKNNTTVTVNKLPLIYGNPIQIHALFKNLIENAIKFSQQNPHPTVKITLIEETNKHCRIQVQDNGIGLDTEKANDLFKPFRRQSNSKAYKGFGMGLAIVHKIITRHNGQIDIASEQGKSTTFTLTLPTINQLA